MDTNIQLSFKLSANTKLDPQQQSEQWNLFIEALEAKGMTFGGGNNEYGFEGSISGPTTKDELISTLRDFALTNGYSILAELPVIQTQDEIIASLAKYNNILCPNCIAFISTQKA